MSVDHYANNENLMRLQTEHAGDDTKTDSSFIDLIRYTIDMERFAGLNICDFSLIEVFTEILSRCLGQKYSLFSIIKERHLYSGKNFHGTLKNRESIAQ